MKQYARYHLDISLVLDFQKRELISKKLIGECWTYSISVLAKLQLKNVPVFLSKLQFIGVSRTNLKEKTPDFFTLQFRVQS